MQKYFDGITTPIGRLHVVVSDKAILHIYFPGEKWDEVFVRAPRHPMILRAKKEFKEYFKGKRKSFTLPLCPEGTEFQKRTWKALLKVSYGTRASYGIVARSSGYPSAARAVGNAIGNNPIPIIIPCHRVVRKDGGLGGYSGGAVIKRKLLSHEARNASA